MSSAMARNILRRFSACCSSWVRVLNLLSLVTPSTRRATSAPEALLDVVEGVLRVLRDVVEEGRGDGDGVEPHLGQDARHGQGVA